MRTLHLVLGALALTVALAACDRSEERPPRAVPHEGVEACRECHPSAWRAWLASRHGRATVSLQMPMAEWIAGREGVPPEVVLPEHPGCLRCHGVGVDERGPGQHGPASRPEEGVTCESCHGPASQHVAAARKETQRPELVANLRHPPRACLDCHRPEPSHRRSGLRPFDEQQHWAKIRHGVEDPPVARWLARSKAKRAQRPKRGDGHAH